MRKLPWVLETVCFRLALLLAIGFLLGCESGESASAIGLDGGELPTRGPARVDGGVEGGVDVGVGEAGVLGPDTRVSMPDALAPALDSQVAVEAAIPIDMRPASCLQQVIAAGYASATASCAKPEPANVSYNTETFASAEAACKFAIDCYAANGCAKYDSRENGCQSCLYAPWSGAPSPFPWLASVIKSYCPTFFTP